ncbi:MAG: SDR family oxidoreductase [Phycisphaerales bacterium]
MSARPVALVTGGVRRVGLAIARSLARAGCDLVLTYRSDADEARAAATDIETLGARARIEPLDLSDLTAVEAFGARMARDLPRLDVVIHNASMYARTPLATLTDDAVLAHYRVNAAAPLLLTRHLAARLAESPRAGGGSVVAIADMHVLGRPRRDLAAYSMSKAALVEMVRVLARELAPRVRVNAIAPGVVAFPETGAESEAEFQAQYLARVPLGRAGTPEDAAEVVRFLGLDAAYVTGEIVRVDGGRWLA